MLSSVGMKEKHIKARYLLTYLIGKHKNDR